MKSDWVVVSVAGVLGLLAIADRPSTSVPAAASPVSSQSAPRVIEVPPVPQLNFSGTETRTQSRPLIFKGYKCTVDCSGHEAGYQWAEDKDIDDPDDCGGNSESFIEGCQAYAEEQQGLSRSGDGDSDEGDDGDYEDEDEDS